MKDCKVKFEDFKVEQLSKNQQKAVRGGDDDEPTKGQGNGNG